MLNATQAEQLYQVSRMTLSRWIKAGRLPADAHGQFEEEALQAALATKSNRGRKPKHATAPAGSSPPLEDGGKPEGGAPIRSPKTQRRGSAGVIEEGHQIRNALNKVRVMREQLRVRATMHQLIPYEIVQRAFSQLGGALDSQFRLFAERTGDGLYAAVQSGKSLTEFRAQLHQEIDVAMRAVLSTIERSIETLGREEGGP